MEQLDLVSSGGNNYLAVGTKDGRVLVIQNPATSNSILSINMPNDYPRRVSWVKPFPTCNVNAYNCTETDGGNNQYQQGTTTGFFTSTNFGSFTDYCTGNYLTEYLCNNGGNVTVGTTLYNCQNYGMTCSAGKCQ